MYATVWLHLKRQYRFAFFLNFWSEDVEKKKIGRKNTWCWLIASVLKEKLIFLKRGFLEKIHCWDYLLSGFIFRRSTVWTQYKVGSLFCNLLFLVWEWWKEENCWQQNISLKQTMQLKFPERCCSHLNTLFRRGPSLP